MHPSGSVAADGPIEEILADTELLEANDLELPYGFTLLLHLDNPSS